METAKNHYEALRAVDPDIAVEGRPAGPQPGDLGVAPLVRGQRGVPERDAYEYRQPEREEPEKWGPPRQNLDRRTALIAAGALAATLGTAIWLFGLGLAPDHYVIVFLVPALVLRRARRYLIDFIPFAVLLVLYAESRGIAHLVHAHAHYAPQLEVDRYLFGSVPSQELQHWLWTGTVRWYDRLTITVWRLHFIVPPLLAFALWMKRRALFYRFAGTLLVLSFAGAATFYLYPAAPPWAAGEAGLLPGVIRIPHNPAPNPSGAHGYHSVSISQLVPANPYAAIPSLHAGYAFLCFLFVVSLAWRTRWRWIALCGGAVYPLAQSWAVVYTGNHYVIDLLAGYAYATAAFVGVAALWRRRNWPG